MALCIDFVVFCDKELFVQRLYLDEPFITIALQMCNKFIEIGVLPELLAKFYSRPDSSSNSANQGWGEVLRYLYLSTLKNSLLYLYMYLSSIQHLGMYLYLHLSSQCFFQGSVFLSPLKYIHNKLKRKALEMNVMAP